MDDQISEVDDLRLIAALQVDGRASIERIAEVLKMTPRAASRRLSSLLASGGVRVVAAPRRPTPDGAMLVRVKILRGKIEAITKALAARNDVAFIDVSVGGNELSVVLLSQAGHRNSLVFRGLPATNAVAEVDAQTILHVFSDASDWRLRQLDPAEQERLASNPQVDRTTHSDAVDNQIIAALAADARLPAAALARIIGHSESTTRRRVNALFADGRLSTQVIVEPARLGLSIDATLRMQAPPDRLDEVGRRLAGHPAVHGAIATTGVANLHVAVWLRDLDHMYRFVTEDLGGLGVTGVDTMIVDPAKRAVPTP